MGFMYFIIEFIAYIDTSTMPINTTKFWGYDTLLRIA